MKDHKKTGRQETNVMFFFYSFVQTITTRSKHGLPNFIRTGYEALDSPCTDYMPLPQKKRKSSLFFSSRGRDLSVPGLQSARVHAMYISLYFIKYILLSTYLRFCTKCFHEKLGLVEIVEKFTSENSTLPRNKHSNCSPLENVNTTTEYSTIQAHSIASRLVYHINYKFIYSLSDD